MIECRGRVHLVDVDCTLYRRRYCQLLVEAAVEKLMMKSDE